MLCTLQVSASVLRNLSWCADAASKRRLRAAGAVLALTRAAVRGAGAKEPTLKAMLSALWNLSAHSSDNKADICGVEGALDLLASTLTYTYYYGSGGEGGGYLRGWRALWTCWPPLCVRGASMDIGCNYTIILVYLQLNMINKCCRGLQVSHQQCGCCGEWRRHSAHDLQPCCTEGGLQGCAAQTWRSQGLYRALRAL